MAEKSSGNPTWLRRGGSLPLPRLTAACGRRCPLPLLEFAAAIVDTVCDASGKSAVDEAAGKKAAPFRPVLAYTTPQFFQDYWLNLLHDWNAHKIIMKPFLSLVDGIIKFTIWYPSCSLLVVEAAYICFIILV